jgi:hypothetical protein
MSSGARERTLRSTKRNGRKVVTMIDWDSENWGGTVHLAANGSWVRDKQRPDSDGQD